MNLSDFEFHNSSGPEEWNLGPGWLLPRYPAAVRNGANETARRTAREAAGVEIRFVTEAPNARVYLSCPEGGAHVMVFRGNFQVFGHSLDGSRVHCLHLTPPDRLKWVRPDALREDGFSPDVWRLLISNGAVLFHGVDAFGHPVRPPAAAEKPPLKWLAYGSSITHSSSNGYPQIAARRLGVDVQNKGLSGSCHIEPEIADYLAEKCDWDFITLELGINMRGSFSPEEFEKRARYLVKRCLEAKPGKPVVLITVFTNYAERMPEPGRETETDAAYNEILRRLAKEFPGTYLIEGSAMLPQFHLLSADLVHPTDTGHARMGEVLGEFLRPILFKSPL